MRPIENCVSKEDIKRVKELGCLQDKRFEDVFNVRVITKNGKISTDEHRVIIEAAEKFGVGVVAITTRCTIEIQGVKYNKIDDLVKFLAENGLETGGTGRKVRPIVTCKGIICRYGLIDTYDLFEKLHERFYKGYHDVELPHKFKIAAGGCPNNCIKSDLNDIGIVGQKIPEFDIEKCKGCKVCQVEKNCPVKAVQIVDGKIKLDTNVCSNCGRCAEKCPFGVTTSYKTGYKICIGGSWGKQVAKGRALSKVLTTDEQVMDAIEKAILLFKDEGIPGERFANTIQRLGFDNVEERILG